MILKLIFDKQGKILGAQIVGQEGVEKRVDTIASTIRQNGDIQTLKTLELAYAPPVFIGERSGQHARFCGRERAWRACALRAL